MTVQKKYLIAVVTPRKREFDIFVSLNNKEGIEYKLVNDRYNSRGYHFCDLIILDDHIEDIDEVISNIQRRTTKINF